MRQLLHALRSCSRGANAIEYGLIAALVVLGAFAGFRNFASTSVNMWNNVSTTVQKG